MSEALEVLCARDRDLARVVEHHGAPPLWRRRPGFATLVHLILEQQVSLASALAVFNRLRSRRRVSAAEFSKLEVEDLRAEGLTRQKASYCIALARAVESRELDLRALNRMPDAAVHEALVRVKGIGHWTADCYLLFCLARPDVWPDGDVALAESARWLKRLDTRPAFDELRAMAAAWSPWRSVGARILWHSYLSGNRGKVIRRWKQ